MVSVPASPLSVRPDEKAAPRPVLPAPVTASPPAAALTVKVSTPAGTPGGVGSVTSAASSLSRSTPLAPNSMVSAPDEPLIVRVSVPASRSIWKLTAAGNAPPDRSMTKVSLPVSAVTLMRVVFVTVAAPPHCAAPPRLVSLSKIISFGDGPVSMPMIADPPGSMSTVAVVPAWVHVVTANAGGATATKKTTNIDDVSSADARSLLRLVLPTCIGADAVLISTSLSDDRKRVAFGVRAKRSFQLNLTSQGHSNEGPKEGEVARTQCLLCLGVKGSGALFAPRKFPPSTCQRYQPANPGPAAPALVI